MVKKSARRKRRAHNPALKAQVALAALRGDKTMAELCKEFAVHAGQVLDWKRQLLDDAADVFGNGVRAEPAVDLAPLHAKIGQLTLETDLFRTRAHQGGTAERKAMIDRDHALPCPALPITRQADLLGMSRGAVYYLRRPTSPADLALMRRIDELHLEFPFMGARMLLRQLQRQGVPVGRRHIATLMLRTGIQALAPQPGTSKRTPDHKVYPYLLRKLAIARSNQVWALDTTYIPMARGFVYLTAVVDVASRRVLAYKVAITLEACHAREVVEQAFARLDLPEIVNTDQGSQFTGTDFTDALLGKGCRLSMDGRGAWLDNVFVERLRRSVKYERVYLKAYDSVGATRTDIVDYIAWYNAERVHSSLADATPDEHYFAHLPTLAMAA